MDGARIARPPSVGLYSEYERLISRKKKDGMYLVVTEGDWSDMPDSAKRDYVENLGITGGVIVYEYRVEPKSLFIASIETYHKGGDGQRTLLLKHIGEKGGLADVPDVLSALMNPVETRTVTLVFNPNTDSEETKSFTFKKDVIFGLVTEREHTMYTDRACTVKNSPDPELVDKTLYVVFDTNDLGFMREAQKEAEKK